MAVLEESLSAIRFAVEPWTPRRRVKEYGEFSLPVYEVTKEVLRRCGGHIDQNEFDFFVSRIRGGAEICDTAAAILAYRLLAREEQDALHVEVRERISGVKAYSNWRDVALHTFSLFSLGTSMIREGARLFLTDNWVKRSLPVVAAVPDLQTSKLVEGEGLLAPPAQRVSNDGSDAESLVAKVLRSQNWEVSFYTNRRGYGFDLWARRADRVIMVEVKSSIAELGAISLTPAEFRAAKEYGDSYLLALVEHAGGVTPCLRLIQNPAARLQFEKRTLDRYVIARAEWLRVAETAG